MSTVWNIAFPLFWIVVASRVMVLDLKEGVTGIDGIHRIARADRPFWFRFVVGLYAASIIGVAVFLVETLMDWFQ